MKNTQSMLAMNNFRQSRRLSRHLQSSCQALAPLVALLLAMGTTVPLGAMGRATPEPLPVVMQLDWIHNAQFAGLYQAEAQGYFADAGLAVEIRPVVRGQKTVEAVLAEEFAIGSAESNVLLKAHSEGHPIRALATMFQGSPMGWMYLERSGFADFADLQGKIVGIHPDGERVLAVMAAHQGFPADALQTQKVGWELEPLLNGEVDAMQAYYIDEYVELQLATEGACGMFLAKDHGYYAYSQVFFTTAPMLAEHSESVEAFLAAAKAGWEYAFAHPEETVDLVIGTYNPELDRAYQLASLAAIEELMRPGGAPVMAPMEPGVWRKAQALYLEHGIIPEPTDLDELLVLEHNP